MTDINDLAAIPLATVKPEALHYQGNTHRTQSKGKGRDKITSSRNGIQTPMGDIKEDVWFKAAEAIIHRDGLDDELKHMVAFSMGGLPRSFRNEYYKRALDTVLLGGYRSPLWYGFIDYNRKYHPELLGTARLVKVRTDCCGAEATFTEEWLTVEYGREHVHCPVCQAWTTYHRITGGEEVAVDASAD